MQDGQIFPEPMLSIKPVPKLDVVGGWYDAGDFGKVCGNHDNYSCKIAGSLSPDTSIVFVQSKLPGSDRPAIIDESIYALDWLLKMQREDGAVYRKVSGASWPAKIGPLAG